MVIYITRQYHFSGMQQYFQMAPFIIYISLYLAGCVNKAMNDMITLIVAKNPYFDNFMLNEFSLRYIASRFPF